MTKVDTHNSIPDEHDGLSRASRADQFSKGNKLELKLLLRIIKMGFAHRYRMVIAILATAGASIFQLFIPRYVGDAVDNAQGLLALNNSATTNAEEALFFAAFMIVTLSVARGLLTMLQNYHGEAIGHCIGYELRVAFYDKIQKLSFDFHDKVHTGDLITRGMLDLEGVRMFISTGVVRLAMLIVLVGGATALMITNDILLTFLALSFVPFVAWKSSVARLRLRWLWLLMQDRLGVITRLMEENLNGIRVVRAFSAEKYELKKFDIASANILQTAINRVKVRVGSTTVMSFSFFLAMGFVLWIGGQKVINDEISVGKLAEFLAFMTILQMPVRQIGMLVNSFARASTCGSRLFEIIDRVPNVYDTPNASELTIGEGTLKFENVSFSFTKDNRKVEVLRNINFSVGAGETLGIVGPPGSGKSTIAQLAPRFYDVDSGTIYINDQDIREISIESLRRFVCVIQQDSFLFTASIENNTAYGNPWVDDDEILSANQAAQFHEHVDQLPLKYKTLVGERGVSLSGGQRQRLSIARGLVTEPAIIIFDDSTASIDAVTERLIRKNLDESSHTRGTIIISHRLTSLMHAKEILFVDKGEIIERGSHEQLISLKGKYFELYQLQTRSGSNGVPLKKGGGDC